MAYFRIENDKAEDIKYDDTKSVKEVIDDIKSNVLIVESFDATTGTLNTKSGS